MKTILERFWFVLLTVVMAASLTGCHYEDGLYDFESSDEDGVEEVKSNYTLSGFIFGKDNQPISGWVSLDSIGANGDTIKIASVVTVYDGNYPLYKINLKDNGNYIMRCGAKGYKTDTSFVAIPEGKSLYVRDVYLDYIGGDTDSGGGSGSGSGSGSFAEHDYLHGDEMTPVGRETVGGYLVTKCTGENELAKIRIDFIADGKDAIEMVMSAVYPRREFVVKNPGLDSLALGDVLCVGTEVISETGNAIASNPYQIKFNIGNAMAQRSQVMYYNEDKDTWEKVDSHIEYGSLVVETSKFGSYGVFANFDTFTTDTIMGDKVYEYHWYNNNQPGGFLIESIQYAVNMGYEIIPSVGTSVLQALMIEYFARCYGYISTETIRAVDFNLELIYLRGMWAIGTQENVHYQINSGKYSIKALHYGNVQTRSWQYGKGIDHTGSSN